MSSIFKKSPNKRSARHMIIGGIVIVGFVITTLALMPSSESKENHDTDLSATYASVSINADQNDSNDGLAFTYSTSRAEEIEKAEEYREKVSTVGKSHGVGLYVDRDSVSVDKGDTLMGLLTDGGANRTQAYEAIEAMRDVFSPRDLKIGQDITLLFNRDKEGARYLAGYMFEPDPTRNIVVLEKHDGGYSAQEIAKELEYHIETASGTISTSLSVAGEEAGVPANVLARLISVYSWDIDFQRDIRVNDSFEVLYERAYDKDGHPVLSGNVIYAKLTLSGKDIPIYRQELNDGTIDYFKPDGVSVRRALMRTPINGARLSSGYGNRKHPILGYNKMHAGLDFAAPTGTPIYASGSGVIEKAGTWGSYGKYVRIRHRNGLKTAYAHMSRIAKGIKTGARVEQKQVIGYVGSTGRSTGPHLHYEVHLNGKKVNPRSVDLPTGVVLKGSELAALKSTMETVNRQYAEAARKGKIKVAQK